MTTYLFTIQFGINVVQGHYTEQKNYRPKKHGIIQHKDKLDYKLTRKEANWYGRNYMNVWSFAH